MLDFGNSGKLMPSELDSGMTTILADMSPSDAIQALADFDLTDLSTICNKSVYLHGLLRAAVDQPGGGGGGAGARPAAASGEGGATRSQDPCPHFHLVPIDGNVKCGHGFWLVRDSEFLLYIYTLQSHCFRSRLPRDDLVFWRASVVEPRGRIRRGADGRPSPRLWQVRGGREEELRVQG